MLTIIFLALAASAISVTITRGKVFEGVRTFVKGHNKWGGDLISCSYCTSHWVSFVLTAIYQPRLIESRFYLVDVILSAFVIIAIASWSSVLILKLLGFEDLKDENAVLTEVNKKLTTQLNAIKESLQGGLTRESAQK